MVEEAPFQVADPIVMDDLSDQETGDVMDAAQGVVFEIEKASIKRTLDKETKEFKFAQLDFTLAVGPSGVDGEGKYANRKFFGWKHLDFPGVLLSFNKEKYITNNEKQTSIDWWKKNSRGITRQFFQALGYDASNLPNIDDSLLGELIGKQFKADILKVDEKDFDGNRTGEKENKLKNFKPVA